MNARKALVVALVIAAIAAFFVFDLGQYLKLDFFKSQQAAIESRRAANPLQAALIFFAVYVAVTGFSLPGAAVMTLAAGAIFGLLWGTVIVSFASSIGATLAFVIARFLLHDWVQGRLATASRRSTTACGATAPSTSSRCAWCRSSPSSSSTWRWR
ncbi:MAG: hypothetical protein M5R42_10570 [Rhodocyclaceae bacterium]|nr:hypothetical protein [Rhodocyclaceae bacterium]